MMNLMQLFHSRRKKEWKDYLRRAEEFDKAERKTQEERYKRRTQPRQPAMTINEIMTKRGETPSEITQKFAKCVK